MVLFEPQLLKFVIQIGQMLFDIFEGGPLGHILRKLVQVSQPHLLVLPVSESDGWHARSLGGRYRTVNEA